MKRTVFFRVLRGFPLGITIGTMISIACSAVWGGGYYAPCVPELVQAVGSELGAVVLQTALCALLGAAFAGLSVIWEIESWSIARQTGVYFLSASVAMLPIAYITCWMEHSVVGFLEYFGIFAVIFALVWLIQYARAKRNVQKLNRQLNRQ